MSDLHFSESQLSWLGSQQGPARSDRQKSAARAAEVLAIFAHQSDEFYMVRVAGLRRQVAAGVRAVSRSAAFRQRLI
jgi:polyphosphate kinase